MKRIADALGINRIRLEFKGGLSPEMIAEVKVLIESDWNLKSTRRIRFMFLLAVLIESDWNLKYLSMLPSECATLVLIESDWNLKCGTHWPYGPCFQY